MSKLDITIYEEAPELYERVRREIPANLWVLEESLPITSFGNPATAQVITVSLNPSWQEFQDKNRQWLEGDKQRVESLRSLNRKSEKDLTDEEVQKVIHRCHSYFNHKPYVWFNQLEQFTKFAGGMYRDGTASHLDLVQWATTKVQRELGDAWPKLVEADASFFMWQLEHIKAPLVLLNGKEVMSQLVEYGIIPEPEARIYRVTNPSYTYITYYTESKGKKYFGWNKTAASGISKNFRVILEENLQSLL